MTTSPARLTSAERFTVAALLAMAATIVLQIAGGADYPAVPPGLLLPLSSAALLVWRPRTWTRLYALANGAWIGFGAIVASDVGDHLDSGKALLVAATYAQLVTLFAVVAGALAALVQHRATAGRKPAKGSRIRSGPPASDPAEEAR